MCDDSWLREKQDYKVDNTFTDTFGDMRVCELFNPGEMQWDVDKVRSLDTAADAKVILALLILRHQVLDRIAWSCSIDGKYSVKSGYKFWYERFSG